MIGQPSRGRGEQLLLSALLWLPLSSWALGLGTIELNSLLNEPLDATIELVSALPSELEALQIELAAPEAFARAGVPYSADLTQLQFALERDEAQGWQIAVTSSAPLREPFLDFIVELNWSSGRLLREYTLLLDPPTLSGDRPPSLEAATVDADPLISAPVTPAMSDPAATEPAPLPPLVYGPVRASDTLWGVAAALLPEAPNASLHQLMMALLAANPKAFERNNVNGLKRGAVLRLDDRRLLTALSRDQAMAAFNEQWRTWRALKQPPTTGDERLSAAAATERTPTPKPSDGGATAVPIAAAPSTSQLQLLPVSEDTPQLLALREEFVRTLELTEAQQRENESLRQRLQALEEQLGALQRLLTLKEANLAQLQAQLEQPTAIGDREASEQRDQEGGVRNLPATTTAPQPAAAAGDPPPINPAIASADPAAATEPVAPTTAVSEPPAIAPPAVAESPPDQMTQWLERLGQIDQRLLYGGIGVALMLLLLSLLIWRRRQQDEVVSDSFEVEGLPPLDADQVAAELAEISGSTTLSATTRTDSSANQSESVVGVADPAQLAEQLWQRGHYQRAADQLRIALQQQPAAPQLLLRLADCYYQMGDSGRFSVLVERHQEQLRQDEGSWQSLQRMGGTLLPEHPLFSSPLGAESALPPVTSAATPPSEQKQSDPDPLPLAAGHFDLAALAAELEERAAPLPPPSAPEPEPEQTPAATTPPAAETANDDPISQQLAALSLNLSSVSNRDDEERTAARHEPNSTVVSAAPMIEIGEEDAGLASELERGLEAIAEGISDTTAAAEALTVAATAPAEALTVAATASAEALTATATDPAEALTATATAPAEALTATATDPAEALTATATAPAEALTATAAPPLNNHAPSTTAPIDSSHLIDFDSSGFTPDPTQQRSDTAHLSMPLVGDASALASFFPNTTAAAQARASGTSNRDEEDDPPFSAAEELMTRLDLATAYIEMGDNASATELLQQVAAQGDADLKQRAAELLARIGG